MNKPPHTEAPAAQDEREAWEQWVSARADMLRTGHNERIFRAGYAAALAARAPQAARPSPIPAVRDAARAADGPVRYYQDMMKKAQAAPAPQPEAAEPVPAPVQPADHHLVDTTERSDQSVQRAAGGGAVLPADEEDDSHKRKQDSHWCAMGGFFHRFGGEDHACIPLAAWRALWAPRTPPVESVERDALRNRLLRDPGTGDPIVFDESGDRMVTGRFLDAAIDAALAGHKEQQP